MAAIGLAILHAALALAFAEAPMFAKYPGLAARLREGGLTAAQVSDASPGYLLLNLFLSPGAVRGLQLAASTATVYLVARAGARLAGPALGLAAAAALALAGPWLLYPSVLEPDLLIGALNLAAVAALLRGVLRLTPLTPALAPRTAGGEAMGERPQRIGPGVAAIAGALLGLSVGLRPTALVLALVALAWIVRSGGHEPAAAGPEPGRRGRMAREESVRPELVEGRTDGPRPFLLAFAFTAALLLFAAAPVLALRTIAGAALERGSSMSVGAVVHLGHRPEGVGLGGNYPTLLKLVELQSFGRPDRTPDYAHELYRTFASAAAGRPLAAPEAERFWLERSLAFAREAPAAFGANLVRKLAFSVAGPTNDHDIPEVQRAALATRVPALPLRWLALAGAGGLLVVLFARVRGTGLLAGWIAAYLATFLVFYAQSRYALAILPAWCLLAASGAAALRALRRDRARLAEGLAIALAPLLLLALPFIRHEARFQERRLDVPIRSEAVALRSEGRWSEALDRFLDEQAAMPDFVWPWSPHGFGLDADSPDHALRAADRALRRYGAEDPVDAYLLAVLYAHGGRCDAALPLLDGASGAGVFGSIADRALDPDLLAADCLVDLDRPAEAFERVRRSLARRPATLDGLSRAIAATAAHPALDARRERAGWERQLAKVHDPASAQFALADAFRRWGLPARALAEADALRSLLPRAIPFAEFERALALLALGRTNEALRAYARSLEIRYPMHGAAAFDPLVRALEAAAPHDPAARAIALAHWMRRGEHERVRALIRRDPALAKQAREVGAAADDRPASGRRRVP